MKRLFCTGTAGLCLILGIARAADLVWNTDPATGFLLSGGIGIRYGLLALVAVLAWLAGRCASGAARADIFSGARGLLVPTAFFSALYAVLAIAETLFSAPEQAGRHQTAGRVLLGQAATIACAMLFLAFAAWCLMHFLRRGAQAESGASLMPLGVAGSAAFYLLTVMRFVSQPASLYRMLPAVEIFAALAALLFVTALLRASVLPCSGAAVCRSGLLAFFLCTCLALPQAIWQAVNGLSDPSGLVLGAVMGCVGLLGAACARSAALPDHT